MSSADMLTALQLFEHRKRLSRITTCSKALDDLLGGGIETQAVTEFAGEFGTGKTFLCHQLAVSVQLPREKGGLEKGAIFIDTESTFRAQRIYEMAEALGLKPEKVLENIIVVRALDAAQQMLSVEKSEEELISTGNYGLLVVDSLTAHFRAEFTGREALPERQSLLSRHLARLREIAEKHNMAVVVTNQVISQPGTFIRIDVPAGGHVVAHSTTYRIFLRKGRGNRRIARLMDSPSHPDGEAIFELRGEGVR